MTGWGANLSRDRRSRISTLDPVIEVANSRTYVHLKGRNGWVLVQKSGRAYRLAGAHFRHRTFPANAAIRMDDPSKPRRAAR